MNTIIRPADRAAWLKEREKGIGSSEIATIMGVNPFETPYQLYRRKKGMDAPKQETFLMKAGHYLEDAVSKFWSDETGHEVIKSSAGDWLIVNTDKPFLRASPDRTYWLDGKKSNENKGILECKTTQMDVDISNLPRHWFCQVQWLLGVSEYEQGSLAWLVRGREFGYQDLAFVPDFFKYMSEEAEKFWVDSIIGNKEPEMTSLEDVLTKFPKDAPDKTIIASADTITTYRQLMKVREMEKEIAEKKEEYEAKLKVAFGDAGVLCTSNGVTLATWKAAKDSESFDSKRYCKEHPDLVKPYISVKTGSRRFLVKENALAEVSK